MLLSGLVGTPVAGRSGFHTREASHVYVNGRAVDASCVHALLDAMFAAAAATLADLADGRAQSQRAWGTPVPPPVKRRRGGGASSTPGYCPCVVFITVARFACDLVPEQTGLSVAFHHESTVLRACADAVIASWLSAGCFADARVRLAVDGAVAAALGLPAPQPQPKALHLGKMGGDGACSCAGCARPVLSLDAWPRRRRGGATSGAALALGPGGRVISPSPGPPPRPEERAAVSQVCTTAAAFGVVPGVVTAQSLQGARLAACVPGTYLLALDAAGCLVAVDQHAADERVLLERMQGRAPVSAAAAAVPCSLHMGLSPAQCAALATHAQGLAAWGWAWTAPARGQAEVEVEITAAPCVEGVVLGEQHFGEWLHSLAPLPPPEPPAASPPPPRVRALLASKACRLAVMFGDDLQPPEGAALLRSLARTRQPLRCAHGRPTTVPLVHAAALCASLDAADAAEEAARTQPLGGERARLLLAQLRH